MLKPYNYLVTSKYSPLTQGHIDANNLLDTILKHDGSEAYSCYFDLEFSNLKLQWDTGRVDKDEKKIYEYLLSGDVPKFPEYKCEGKTFVKYEGICRPALNFVSFDFDNEESPEKSLEDVRDFIKWLEIENLIVFFSGSKGFHVLVPFAYFGLEEGEHLANQLKDLARSLKQTYKTLDASIYNYNRKFRVPFSKHPSTGLYKTLFRPDQILSLDIEDIKGISETRRVINFVENINFNPEVSYKLQDALEDSKRETYEVEKDKAGTIDLPSNFERFDDKLCIKKMLESRCDEGRNNACLRIVNDCYRTGKTQNKCEELIYQWSKGNDFKISEANEIINNVYNRGANYNFGCQDEIKALYCSAKCSLWKKLSPDKRPLTADMPVSAIAESNGKKQPKEFEVVSKILTDIFECDWNESYRYFDGGNICKQGMKDLFLYKEGYWQHLTNEQICLIKIKFNAIYDNILDTRKIDAIFKMFMLYVPSKPKDVDMFVPKSTVANFKNGTLHLYIDGEGKYTTEFKPHDRNDFLTFVIPMEFDNSKLNISNEMFESWLMDCLDGDIEQFNLAQEMFGASLAPCFPQLFAIVGESDTGKSTLIKILKRLHGEDEKNISKVSPHEFNGFHMSSMVGKLINIVMDINVQIKIDDAIVKQIEDRDTVRVQRKGEEDVYAPLPALHVFGANSMPKTLEGYSGSMNKRWSMLKFDKVFTGKKNRNIAAVLFNNSPIGILNFAIKGLLRLAVDNQGFFSGSKQSAHAVKEWAKKDDIIQLFLEYGESDGIELNGEKVYFTLNEGEIIRGRLWDLFNAWQDQALARNEEIGRNKFFQMLEMKKMMPVKSYGTFVYRGVSEKNGHVNASDKI